MQIFFNNQLVTGVVSSSQFWPTIDHIDAGL